MLSLGSSIALWTRRGSRVDVVTVFAGDPGSIGPASKWDTRAGFATEAEATWTRRDEDRRACAFVRARPVWLAFPDERDKRRDPQAVLASVTAAVAGADAVLLPGFPLTHPDHAWLTGLLLGSSGLPARVAVYREQPYWAWYGSPRVPNEGTLARALEPQITWAQVAVGLRERRAKWRAARSYESQLRLLGLSRRGHARLLRLLWDELRAGGEAIAWLP